MSDDEKTEETKAWTYTAPKDGEVCYKDLKHYAAADCADAATDAASATAEGKLGKAVMLGTDHVVKACAEDKITLWPVTAATAGSPTDTEVTTALEQAEADVTAVELAVDKTAAAKDGKIPCQAVGTASVTFTAGGWAAPSDDTDSGAKTLAAAFAAGALAVAATQF